MRGPRQVISIGQSLVRLVEVTGERMRFAGVDLVGRTPVIDIKPYVTQFDRPTAEPRSGWFDTVALQEGITPAALNRRPCGSARTVGRYPTGLGMDIDGRGGVDHSRLKRAALPGRVLAAAVSHVLRALADSPRGVAR